MWICTYMDRPICIYTYIRMATYLDVYISGYMNIRITVYWDGYIDSYRYIPIYSYLYIGITDFALSESQRLGPARWCSISPSFMAALSISL